MKSVCPTLSGNGADANMAGQSPSESRTDTMNASRLTSRYPEWDDPPIPSIKPTARARTGKTRNAHPSQGRRPAISAEATPTIEPIRMPVHGPLSEPPRSPTPTPTAIPKPAPSKTSPWTPVIA